MNSPEAAEKNRNRGRERAREGRGSHPRYTRRGASSRAVCRAGAMAKSAVADKSQVGLRVESRGCEGRERGSLAEVAAIRPYI